MNILCLIGIHKDEYKRKVVFRIDNIESGDSWLKCKRCGRETEKSGYTYFGPIDLTIK